MTLWHSATRVRPCRRPIACKRANSATRNAVQNFSDFNPHANYKDAAELPAAAPHACVDRGVYDYRPAVLYGPRRAVDLAVAGSRAAAWRTQAYGAPSRLRLFAFPVDQLVFRFLVMLSMLGLAITGLLIKYADYRWSQTAARFLGGLHVDRPVAPRLRRVDADQQRGLCRVAACGSAKQSGERNWKANLLGPDSPVPNSQDVKELFGMLRWFVGLGPKPTFDRWTYWEKFDYWAIVSIVVFIGTSGLVDLVAQPVRQILTGAALNEAQMVHYEISLMATSYLLAIRYVNTHFRPEKFPMDLSAMTGLVSEEHLKRARPRFLERMQQQGRWNKLRTTFPSRNRLTGIIIAAGGDPRDRVGAAGRDSRSQSQQVMSRCRCAIPHTATEWAHPLRSRRVTSSNSIQELSMSADRPGSSDSSAVDRAVRGCGVRGQLSRRRRCHVEPPLASAASVRAGESDVVGIVGIVHGHADRLGRLVHVAIAVLQQLPHHGPLLRFVAALQPLGGGLYQVPFRAGNRGKGARQDARPGAAVHVPHPQRGTASGGRGGRCQLPAVRLPREAIVARTAGISWDYLRPWPASAGSADGRRQQSPVTMLSGRRPSRRTRASQEDPHHGMKLRCTSCHSQDDPSEHIAVSTRTCFLCHFKQGLFNEGVAACTRCHQIPEERFDLGGGITFTHDLVYENGVDCKSCHGDLNRGSGNVARVRCQVCHNREVDLEKIVDGKLMHEVHVTEHKVDCMDCHEEITHSLSTEKLTHAASDCASCHPDHHREQVNMLLGVGGLSIPEQAASMSTSRVQCIACHREKQVSATGTVVWKASADVCSACHTAAAEPQLASVSTTGASFAGGFVGGAAASSQGDGSRGVERRRARNAEDDRRRNWNTTSSF